jgi:glycosyltransferase involved in cell wall biosynthesis
MKILLLSQWCYPEPDARIFNMAQLLSEMGHQVQILTGFPNYPGGKIYSGYKLRFFRRQWIEGVAINRIWLYPSHDRSTIRRSLNYLSFAFSATFLGPFVISKPEIIYVYHPPATSAIPAFFLKLLFHAKLVYDIQDLWPDSIKATGMAGTGKIIRVINWFQNGIYGGVDMITVIADGMRKILIERKVPADKIRVIWNWSIPLSSVSNLNDKIDFGHKFTIVYAGNHGPAQGLKCVLDAGRMLMAMKIDDVQFVLIGSGPLKYELKQYASVNNLQNVTFIDRISPESVRIYLEAADVLLISLIKDPLFKITIPSKTQSYMMIGKPILAGVEGDTEKIIKEADVGLTYIPENVDDMVEKIIEFKNLSVNRLKEMGQNGEKFYITRMSREVGVKKFIDVFEALSRK